MSKPLAKTTKGSKAKASTMKTRALNLVGWIGSPTTPQRRFWFLSVDASLGYQRGQWPWDGSRRWWTEMVGSINQDSRNDRRRMKEGKLMPLVIFGEVRFIRRWIRDRVHSSDGHIVLMDLRSRDKKWWGWSKCWW